MPRYALILNSIVVNVIIAEEDYIESLESEALIDDGVALTDDQIVNIGDSYSGGIFGPFIPSLPVAKAQVIAALQADIQRYVDDRYTLLTRLQFLSLYTLAKFQGLTTRSAYLEPLLTWINSILGYAAVVAASINAQTNAATVIGMTGSWNIDANVLPNPNLTVAAAVALTGAPVTLDPISAAEKAYFNGKLNAVTYSASTPSRTLDSDFTPSATYGVMAFYTIRIVTTLLSPTGSVELRSDTNSTPTTIRSRVSPAAIGTEDTVVSYLVPPGHNVRLVSAGSATISIVNQSEVALQVT